MTTTDEVEAFVLKHGESYRRVITEALTWLDSNEHHWKLDDPIKRDIFVENLIERASTKGSQ